MARTTVLYIVSPRYSGSTLLCYLLATHPDIATIGERRHFYFKRIHPTASNAMHCSCGALFTECPFWNDVQTRFLADVGERPLGPNFTGFRFFRNDRLNAFAHELTEKQVVQARPVRPFRRQLDRVCSANAALIRAVLTAGQGTVFLDASKPLRHAIFFSSMPSVEVRVINLVRDMRGQVYSALKYKRAWDSHTAAQHWQATMARHAQVFAHWDVPRYDLRYEDLCADPDGVVRELWAFAGLTPMDQPPNFRDVPQHIMGNGPMRLGTTKEIVDRQRWREVLTPHQLEAIEAVAGDMNRRWGYDA